ncbi:MAG TPA: FAD-dependent oxidoreductase, partial [Fibrobacteraceae bacterium]|nr:FAD-dependent oxidoreductase [Fibrobacteraceae bacterium]
IENYPGVPRMSGIEFADHLFSQVTELGVELEIDEVIKIESEGSVHHVFTSSQKYDAKAVIIATGAKHRTLGLEKEELFTGHGVSYCALCDGAFFKNKRVAIVGGGNTAITEAIYLSTYCESVTIIHRRDSFRADLSLMNQAESKSNIFWTKDTIIQELVGEKSLSGLKLLNTKTNSTSLLSVEGLFVAIGHLPQTKAFSELVPIDAEGFFDIGEDCKSPVPSIYVAGDCRKKNMRQLTTAVADGANASMAVSNT